VGVDQVFQVVVGQTKLMKPGSCMMNTLVYKKPVNLDCFLERLPSPYNLTDLNASYNQLPRVTCATRKEQNSFASQSKNLSVLQARGNRG